MPHPRAMQHLVSGIAPANIVDEFQSRKLDDLSDADLFGQIAAIVSKPPRTGLTSFTLHAPLELMARYGLLPLVDPRDRSLARLQMVASAAAFESGVSPAAPPRAVQPFADLASAKDEFTRTFRSGDADGLESLVVQIAAQFGTACLVHLLTPLALPTLTGAAHSHIGLWLLLRHGRGEDVADASLLRAAARNLAQGPNLRMSSFSGLDIAGDKPLKMSASQIERDIFEKLADPPKGRLTSESLKPLIQAGEETGNPDALFGEFIRHELSPEQMDAAFRAILRVCAHSMLQDDLDQAKYGWSHCLTLPQAACGLSSLNLDRKLALAAAFVWIIAHRSVLSKRALDFSRTPERIEESISIHEALHTSPSVAAARVWRAGASEMPLIRRTLATEAAIRNDQHLAKYTRACFDMGSFDPTQQQLYLAAAAHLCALWIRESPRESITDNLPQGRNTP